jgi:hypothetical protein
MGTPKTRLAAMEKLDAFTVAATAEYVSGSPDISSLNA